MHACVSRGAGVRIRGPADRGNTGGGCTPACRRRRQPGDALIELNVALGLAEEVAVRHRLRP